MSHRGKKTQTNDQPKGEHCFRHWVESRDLRDDSVRTLPVTAYQNIFFGGKKNTPERPPEQVIRVEDVGRVWEAPNLEDLSRQLREQYSDGAFQRTLKRERDFKTEERRRTALNELIQILA